MNLKKLLIGIAVFVLGVGVSFLQLLPEVSREIFYLGLPLAVFGGMLIVYSFDWGGHGHVNVKPLPQVDRDVLLEYFYRSLLHLYDDAVKIYISKDKMRAVFIRNFEYDTFRVGELCLDIYDNEQAFLAHSYGGWVPVHNGVFGLYDTLETAIKENAYCLNDMEEVDVTAALQKDTRKLIIVRKKGASFKKTPVFIDERKFYIANGATFETDIDEGMHVLDTPYSTEFIGSGSEDITLYIKGAKGKFISEK